MAAASEVSDVDAKLEALKQEIIQTFNELYMNLFEHRDNLLSRLAKMKEGHYRNIELDKAINQLEISRNNFIATMTSNFLGKSLDTIKERLDRDIELKIADRVPIDNLKYVEFCCFSAKIRKAIKEIDMIELIPEYVGRENPVLRRCSKGRGNGKFRNPRGISIDSITNEVFVADKNNSRIQVLNTEGEYLRSFGTDHLKEPYGICVSQDGVFVTDDARESLLRFSRTGEFIKKTGSRGTTPGCFSGIMGLCYDVGSVYVCDCNVQRIQIFDINLQLVKDFGFREIKLPTDITIYSYILYILSQEQNIIYCYSRDGTYLKRIELTGQEQMMTTALFFTMDKMGNFIISDNINNEIRIFSPNGVLKHTLGRGHLKLLSGVTIDNSNSIICMCSGDGNDRFQKY